ncbi:uncharacterized protein LOC107039771 [Diachasma alloeum]|uniref:uncharacterized protein LOC107039771 n=1 Tax=Diachasma alloeum TaxID=454923 RepID=UPI0007381D7B|nr:uncharacterized protein LOC107039771 [Diachasma alloeum]
MRNYKRKTDRQSWSSTDMAQAIAMVVEKKLGINKAAQLFSVPSTTLQNRVKKYQSGCSLEEAAKKGLGKFKAIFTEQQEKCLVEYIQQVQKTNTEKFTTKDLRKLAYQLAEKCNVQHKFNAEDGMAGLDWYTGFMKRHPELSFRKPKSSEDYPDHHDCLEIILEEPEIKTEPADPPKSST